MNVIFDIGMVLADFRWRAYCNELGIPEEVTDIFADKMICDPVWDEFDMGIRPYREVIAEIGERFPGYEKEYALFWKDITRLVLPFDYSEGWLRSLKERGHGVYLLSNYPGFMFDIHSKGFGFMNYTDGRVISYEYNVMKPDRRIYEILLEKYGLDPSGCIFTDDRPVNIEGAERCGIKGILFEGFEKTSAAINSITNGR
ncbi:MAG: HAD family phosphatase [Oscillospiraceae bacterium]|nr:HAD family phosphatase [Oscillospiraceae bacterium]